MKKFILLVALVSAIGLSGCASNKCAVLSTRESDIPIETRQIGSAMITRSNLDYLNNEIRKRSRLYLQDIDRPFHPTSPLNLDSRLKKIDIINPYNSK